MISQWSADGRETRYDPRQMIRWEAMETDALECWHGPLERWEGTVLIAQEHGCVFLDRNEASLYNALREEIISRKASAERMAEALRKVADGCDEVRGVRGC
jgi:hypothetical protein